MTGGMRELPPGKFTEEITKPTPPGNGIGDDIPPYVLDGPPIDHWSNGGGEDHHEPPPLPWIDMSNWDNEPVPQPEWAVLNRIPLRQCALFTGEGAAGKSTIELHRAAAHVLGRDWLGTMPKQGPALYIDAEDGAEIIHHRLDAIRRHYDGVTYADLVKNGLHTLSLVGPNCDPLLATANRNGVIVPTTTFKQLRERVADTKPVSITIASCADVFAGDENDRYQVRQFVRLLTGLTIISGGSLVLVSHPSLTGISTGTGLSGSTQWHNAVRARFYIKGTKPGSGEQPDNDLREIVFKKNQYGPKSDNITLRYTDGMFLPVKGKTSIEKVAHEADVDRLFLSLLTKINNRNDKVSSRVGAHAYAPTVLAAEAEAKEAGVKKDAFKDAMARLLDADKIHNEQYGPKSRDTWKLVTGGKPK
jgi:RecA-family ATPase